MSEEIAKVQPDPLAVFLESHDFMRLGQAINRGQWDSAMMILRRLESSVRKLGISSMEQPLKGVRLGIMGRNSVRAKQSLSLLVTRRVSLLNRMRAKEQ